MQELLRSFHRYGCLEILRERTRRSGQSLSVVSSTPSVEAMAYALAGVSELANV